MTGRRVPLTASSVLVIPFVGPGAPESNAAPYQALFEMASDCEFILDNTARIRRFNPAAERALGGGGRDLTGLPFLETVVARSRPGVEQALQAALGGGPQTSRPLLIAGQRRDGTTFAAELAVRALEEEGEGKYAVVVRVIAGPPIAQEEPEVHPPDEQEFDLGRLLFAQRLKDLV